MEFLNKKKIGLLIGIIFFLIVAGGMIIFLSSPAPPEDLINKAFENTLKAETYRYEAVTKRIKDKQEEVLTQVSGKKQGENVHFYGKVDIVNADLEVYRINNKLYRKDYFSKDWLVIEGVKAESTENLMQEINPLSLLEFKGEIEAEDLGKEKVNNIKCRKYQVTANWSNAYLQSLWENFNYLIWVDTKNKTIVKSSVSAENKKDNSYKLMMEVEFTNLGGDVIITPPLND